MNQEHTPERRAISNEVLDIHLNYLRGDVVKILDQLKNMATKQDIKSLEDRMSSFATKEELRHLRAELSTDGVHKTLNRWSNTILKISAVLLAGGTIVTAVIALVHFWDKIK